MKKIMLQCLVAAAALGLMWCDVEIFRAECHFQEGERERTEKHWAGALEKFEEAARILPGRSAYQRAMGQTSHRLYEPGSGNLRPLYQSYAAYQQVVQLDPLYPYGWFEMADVLDDFDRAGVSGLPSAEDYYRRALEIDPTNPRFLAGQLDWQLRHGRREAAWGLFLSLIRSYPSAIREIGPAMLKTDRDFARLDREIDVSGPAALYYARYLIKVGRMEEAEGLLGRITGDRETRSQVASLMSSVLLSRGELDQAREVLTQALAQNPGNFDLNVRLAKVLDKQGDGAGAIAAYKKALAYHPRHLELAWAAANVARKTGRDQEAIDLLTRILDTGQPNLGLQKAIFKARAQLREKRRDFKGAIADYERYLELDPDNDDATHAIKRIKIEMEYAGHGEK